jgi:hypothetical protein
MTGLKSELLFEMEAELDPMVEIGVTPSGHRMIAHVGGGWFKGPRIAGKVLPGGGDWALVRADGVLVIDVRATLEAEDGTRIYASYGGRLAVPPELAPRVFDREQAASVDPSLYYFRTNPLFDVPAGSSHAWLNNVVAIGVGRVTGRGVAYHVYAIG